MQSYHHNLLELIAQGENQFVEFKQSFQKEVIESVVAFANAFKEAGVIEKYGSGIQRIKDECKIHGVKAPIFEEFDHGFRVTLFKAADVTEGVTEGVTTLYEYIKSNPHQRVVKISHNLDIPPKTIERWIKKLRDMQLIEYQGSPKTGGYIVTKGEIT